MMFVLVQSSLTYLTCLTFVQLESPTILERLAPETRELIETIPGGRRKEVVEGAALPAWLRLSGQSGQSSKL